jgi:hypothetical protein
VADIDKKVLYGNIAKESGGFALAEMVSMSTSLLVVGIADTLAPNMIKDVSKFVGKHVIEPFLDPIESTLGAVCKISECQPDKTKSRAERAENMIVFSAAWATSMAAKVATRRIFNRAVGISDDPIPAGGLLSAHEKRILLYDEGVHYGSILLMNTAGAKVTDELIASSTNVLTKVGIPEKKAKELSSMAVIWELPNLLGMAAGIGAIFQNHLGSKAKGA